MVKQFINPTEKGKNILMLRYVISFLLICLIQFLWLPVWQTYKNTLPMCESLHWTQWYYLFLCCIPLCLALFNIVVITRIVKNKQYPFTDSLVMKSTLILKGAALKNKILTKAILIFFLTSLSLTGIYMVLNCDYFKNNCDITLFE